MKHIKFSLLVLIAAVAISSCQKGELDKNPNLADESAAVAPSLILNRLDYGLYQGGGVVETRPGYMFEGPWDVVMHWNQYVLSNFSYYRSTNAYNWSNTATAYDVIRYASRLELRSQAQFGTTNNAYYALAKFYRAYAFIWLTQRVGDIPMTEAGDRDNETPTYDTQHDVYKKSLDLLDSANIIMSAAIAPGASINNSALKITGDIFGTGGAGFTYGQWQKVINSYKLRVLMSLSKRADDNADLKVKEQFLAIVSDPVKYPIFTSNADNLSFIYNSLNIYPRNSNDSYNVNENIGSTYLNLTTAAEDPRTFVVATPAPAQMAAPNNKSVGDFSAYVGADPNLTLNDLNTNGVINGLYSNPSFIRYYTNAGSEPYVIVGYPEMCFNIAEAAARGWLPAQSAATWYLKGINASLASYGVANGTVLTVGTLKGAVLGTVTADVTTFLNNVAYAGDNAAGIQQILEQKYVAMFQNSGYEAYYNWRRTGFPAFAEGGAGIGTASNKIPRRWLYPIDEKTYNTAHLNDALSKQYSGTDDVTKDTWLTK